MDRLSRLTGELIFDERALKWVKEFKSLPEDVMAIAERHRDLIKFSDPDSVSYCLAAEHHIRALASQFFHLDGYSEALDYLEDSINARRKTNRKTKTRKAK